MSVLLLDTCAILWSILEPEALSSRAREAVVSTSASVLISPISCAEIACACSRGRVKLNQHWKTWCRNYFALNGWQSVPIDMKIMEEAYSLPEPFHQDPADRIIVATGRIHSATIVTGDRKILDFPHVETLW